MGKMEVYMNSLETKVQVANSSRIYECDASTICDAIFSTWNKWDTIA